MIGSEKRIGSLFLAPGLIFILIFIFVPIIYALYMSFFEWKLFDLGAEKTFSAARNYARILSDGQFLGAALNTVAIVLVCLVIEIVLGFIISLALWNVNRSLRVVHSILLLPMITSPVIVSLIWRCIYDPQFGILNYVLRNTLGTGNLAWLGDTKLALPSVMLVDIWQMTSYVILILYSGMISISPEYLEAARVDGASFPQIVMRVIIPVLSPLLLLVMMLRTMDLFKIFDTVYVLTRGGPGSATETLSTYIYKTSFQYYEMGYAMALSLVTLAFILIVSVVYMKAMNKKD